MERRHEIVEPCAWVKWLYNGWMWLEV